VGVLNADTALSMPDFRASERTFHLLVQVAGRAGRAGSPGRVLIQTRSTEHPAIQSAQHHDVRAFIKNELVARRELNYPPFSHVALVRLDGKDEAEVASEAKRLALLVEELRSNVEILGPAPAPISRLRDRYRYRFMLRSSERGPLRAALLCIVRAPLRRQVHTTVDVDPLNML
jgi:primosomal protein N' (replication factor Y)